MMKTITEKEKVTLSEIKEMSEALDNLVKAVVDVEKEVMAVDAELHSDEEAALLEEGSSQENLWGINLYPEFLDDNFVEFDSMINLRPSQNNRSRDVEDPRIREKILKIVNNLVER